MLTNILNECICLFPESKWAVSVNKIRMYFSEFDDKRMNTNLEFQTRDVMNDRWIGDTRHFRSIFSLVTNWFIYRVYCFIGWWDHMIVKEIHCEEQSSNTVWCEIDRCNFCLFLKVDPAITHIKIWKASNIIIHSGKFLWNS